MSRRQVVSQPTRWIECRPWLVALFAACLLCVWAGVSPAHADPPTFDEQHPFGPATSYADALVAGDMDGDGALDLVMGGTNGIYFNDGHGNFDRFATFEGDGVDDVAVGDLNGDGHLDLVAASNGYQSHVYLNDGRGQLVEVRPFGESTVPSCAVALGDMDGDGDLDIVEANDGWLNRIYWNVDGQGNFAGYDTFGTDGPSCSVALGDMNGDGRPDIVVGNRGDWGSDPQPNQVCLNDGSGGFASCLSFIRDTDSPDDPGHTWAVALGDLDGDGDLDVAVANRTHVIYSPEQSYTCLNDGAGILACDGETQLGSLDWFGALALADLDQDGALDIVAGGMYANAIFWGGTAQVALGSAQENTRSIVVADLDNDGFMDVAAGNYGQCVVYLSDGEGADPGFYSLNSGETGSLALGDLDNDGDVDVVAGEGALAVPTGNRAYLNDGAGTFPVTRTIGSWEGKRVAIALGDMDGDRDLDVIVVRREQASSIYFNDGAANFPLTATLEFGTAAQQGTGVAVGDLDGDGDLDVVAGNDGQQNRVFLNDGAGDLEWPGSSYAFGESGGTQTMALGDLDGDGDLDLVDGGPNRVYLNDGAGLFAASHPIVAGGDTRSVALGDLDGDGDLDAVLGNAAGYSLACLNDGDGHFSTIHQVGLAAENTLAVALGDLDGDGDPDVYLGNFWQANSIYINDGLGTFGWTASDRVVAGGQRDGTTSLAVGDLDGDGMADLVVGNALRVGDVDWQDRVYLNRVRGPARLPNAFPTVSVARPGATADGALYSTPEIVAGTIPITYTVRDREGDPIRVRAFYSPDGGGRWLPAVAASGTVTLNLASSPTGTMHTYVWDSLASGFFGQSDNVVVRIEVAPGPAPAAWSIPGPFLWPSAAAATFPFRVRGTQVRVMDGAAPGRGALVYRFRPGDETATPVGNDAGLPYRTDTQGYLQGRGQLSLDPPDRLVALLPITATETYTLYHTSAAPSATGIGSYAVDGTGVQTLTVTATHPLYLFNLDLSLEWDARNDGTFLEDLELAVRRASALFYDVTDGQAAIGTVRIYQDRENWPGADVVIYAQNGVRPRASMGGVATDLTPDVDRYGDPIPNAYGPGQVRMGPNWDPFGQSLVELDNEWGRALAHELAHYLLYLPDNYLGIGENGAPTSVDCKGSFMTNTYDDLYSELLPRNLWDEPDRGCRHTIAMSTTGRADWQTVGVFYDAVYSPTATFDGPSSLPLDVTRVAQVPLSEPCAVLPALVFDLRDEDYALLSAPGAQGYLFKTRGTPDDPSDDAVISLGQTVADGDRIKVRGAEVGDRLCILGPYDPALPGTSPPLSGTLAGCIESLNSTHRAVRLSPAAGWQPNVVVTAVTSRTLVVTATLATAESRLNLQVFPTYGALTATEPISAPLKLMTAVGPAPALTFTASLTLAEPCFELMVRVWVPRSDPSEPPREMISALYLSPPWGPDSPGVGGLNVPRAWGANKRQLGAPVASGDGGVTIWNVTDILADTGTASLQAVHNLPGLASWLIPAGQGYRFVAGERFPRAIAFNYLQRTVPAGFENLLYVYYSPDDGATWRRLPTTLDTAHNQAAAVMPDDPETGYGQGLYALLSTIDMPPFQPGWNLFGYPLLVSRPVTEALASLEGYYTTIYGHYTEDPADPWKVYDVTVAPPFQTLVNDLHALSFGHGYWITISQAITLSLEPPTDVQIKATLVPRPPATYYGQVLAGHDWAPAEGMPVQAWIGGHACGASETARLAGGQIAYAVQVLADEGGATLGCGAPGRLVRFTVDGRSVPGSVAWRDHQAWLLDLAPGPTRAYLPLIWK
ncbi:MAG TPA: VCBS repeat-containing protein [Anaerolineae bacterium]|nr:VCBS repeat-containing protein [Anaerolineae bacterium]